MHVKIKPFILGTVNKPLLYCTWYFMVMFGVEDEEKQHIHLTN